MADFKNSLLVMDLMIINPTIYCLWVLGILRQQIIIFFLSKKLLLARGVFLAVIVDVAVDTCKKIKKVGVLWPSWISTSDADRTKFT